MGVNEGSGLEEEGGQGAVAWKAVAFSDLPSKVITSLQCS